jgi:hypothetical protein
VPCMDRRARIDQHPVSGVPFRAVELLKSATAGAAAA